MKCGYKNKKCAITACSKQLATIKEPSDPCCWFRRIWKTWLVAVSTRSAWPSLSWPLEVTRYPSVLVQRRRLLPTMTTTKRSTLESTLELGECSTAGILASWTHLSFSLHAGWQTPWPASTAFTRLLSTTGAGTLSALSSSQRIHHHPGRSALIVI